MLIIMDVDKQCQHSTLMINFSCGYILPT